MEMNWCDKNNPYHVSHGFKVEFRKESRGTGYF